MELIDLLSGFDLSHLSDSSIQTVARGLAVTLILEPVRDLEYSNETLPAMRRRVCDACISYMKKAIEGNLFDKIALVAAVKKRAGKPQDFLSVHKTAVDPSALIAVTRDMHIHHMSESDYKKIAEGVADLAFGSGESARMLERKVPQSERKLLEQDVICKIYSGLYMALKEKDSLMEQARQSKERAQKH